MNEELDEDLDYGKELARLLVRHMDAMGAGGCTIPVIFRDETYEVVVRQKPITPIDHE